MQQHKLSGAVQCLHPVLASSAHVQRLGLKSLRALNHLCARAVADRSINMVIDVGIEWSEVGGGMH